MQYLKTQKGFSLMELLIVIFIVSLVYFLGFDGFSISSKSSNPKTPSALLQSFIQQTKDGKLICINECQTCFFKKDLKTPAIKIDKNFNFGKNIHIYKVYNDSLSKIDFGRYKDEKICMIINFYKNSSHSKFIFQNDKNIFFISPLSQDIQKVNSLTEAKDLWNRSLINIQNGDFY